MEMHQVRYFLAVARALNFTRAAEECNVTQPALTRAIRQLEEEFGDTLFRRERPHAQLTELGQRMLPLMQQCYEGALAARSLASSMKSGETTALRLALSLAFDLSMLIPHINEVRKYFKNLEVKLLRGTASDAVDFLKEGQAELAIASSLEDSWDRTDQWPLYSETFSVIMNGRHPLAGNEFVTFEELRDETILIRSYCEHVKSITDLCRSHKLNIDHAHELSSPHDLAVFLEQGFGLAFAPPSESLNVGFVRKRVEGLDLRRTVLLYGVAGRQRTPAASAILKSLRGADWSQFSSD